MVSESVRKKPVGLIIFGILFIFLSLQIFTANFNGLKSIATKNQFVKVMEDSLEQARGTQDHKPSALQVEFVEALKEYKVSVIDYVFKILGILYGIVLFIIAIATLTNKKWTVLAVNLVVSYTLVVELIENAIFTFIKPLPSPITIHLAYNQKIFLYVQNFIPVLAIALLILWYFNRIQIIKFLKSN